MLFQWQLALLIAGAVRLGARRKLNQTLLRSQVWQAMTPRVAKALRRALHQRDASLLFCRCPLAKTILRRQSGTCLHQAAFLTENLFTCGEFIIIFWVESLRAVKHACDASCCISAVVKQ